jgi:hypothetical protein
VLFHLFKGCFINLIECYNKQHDFLYSYLLVCVINVLEVSADGGDRSLEVEASAEFCLKLIKVGGTVSGNVRLDELD